MNANRQTTSTWRPSWADVAVIVVTVTGLIGVARSVIADPTGSVTFSGARPVAVNVVAGGLGLPAVPGGTVTAPVTVSNPGAAALRYAVVSTVNASTSSAGYTLTIKTGVTACTATGFSASGTVVYDGPLGSPAGIKVVGDSAVGAQPGDRVLAAGASDVICTQVTLPAHTGNDAASLSLQAELLTVNAEPVD